MGALGLGHPGGDGRVELQLALDGHVGHGQPGLLGGAAHLVHVLPLAGAEGGVAEEGHLGVHAEDFGALDGLGGDLHQLVLAGLDVDGAVRHSQHVVVAGGGGAHQDKAGGHDGVARLGLDQLEGGADSVGGGVGGAAQQGVGHAHGHQHGAKVVALLQHGLALVGGHFALAQLYHPIHHGAHVLIGLRVIDDGAPDVEASVLGGGLDLGLIADEDGGQESAGQQPGGGLQNAGVGALGKDDFAGVGFQDLDEFFEHVITSFQIKDRRGGAPASMIRW